MAQISTNDFRAGAKVEVEGQPYILVFVQFVKPGKGQAFTRTKLKHILTGRVIEKTFKSGDKVDIANVEEIPMRLLYTDAESAVFMNDQSFEQVSIGLNQMGDTSQWLMPDLVYSIIFYNGNPVNVEPPTFIEMKITETSPGIRGDSSGRVLKAAITESGAKVQIPIFIEQDEIVKIDTRTGEYVSRAT